MNIFKYEFSSNLKIMINWTLAMMSLSLVLLSFYPMLSEDISLIVDLISNYPEALRNAFGFNVEIMNSIMGYFSTMPMSFLLICATLEAMLLGINIFSKEQREKTSDFLFTKPISRLKIMIYKLLAASTLVLLFGFILFIFNLVLLNVFESDGFDFKLYLLLFLSIIFLQIFFMILGMLIAIFSKRIKSPIAITMAVVLGFYAFNAFIEDKMTLLIPYKYFDIDYIIKNNSYNLIYFVLFILIIIIMIIVSYKKYINKDIHVI
jgi:ABC-2 type transport system permease protein